MRSIKTKLAVIIGAFSVVIISMISYFNCNAAAGILMEQIQSEAAASAEKNAQVIDAWLLGVQKEIEVLAQLDAVQSLEPEQYMPVTGRMVEKNKDYEAIYVVDGSGSGFTTAGDTVNIAERSYFIEAMATGKSVISDPVPSRTGGGQVIPVGTPVYKEGNAVGFVGAAVKLDHLQALVENMHLNGCGYGAIQNDDLTTIAHPDKKWLGNKDIVTAGDERLTDIFRRMSRCEQGCAEYSYEGVSKTMAFAPIETTGWSLAQTADMADVMAPLTGMRTANLTITAVGLLVMIIVAVFFAGTVARPLVELSRVAGLVAEGDLTQKVAVKGQDEIGRLAIAFNEMIIHLKDMTLALREKAAGLASSAQQLSAGSEEASAGAAETTATMTEISSTVEQAAQNVGLIRATAEITAAEAETGRTGVRRVTGQMHNIDEAVRNVVRALNSFSAAAERIGVIVQTITEIADQTNLLALNAAIEAARVGEHGRGFTVVAEEVRKLAEGSAQAAREIRQLIAGVQAEAKQTFAAMEQGAEEVQRGVAVVEEVGRVFTGIVNQVEGLAGQIDEIVSGTGQISAAVQNVAGSTEEVTAAMEEVASSADILNQMAGELRQMTVRFKV